VSFVSYVQEIPLFGMNYNLIMCIESHMDVMILSPTDSMYIFIV